MSDICLAETRIFSRHQWDFIKLYLVTRVGRYALERERDSVDSESNQEFQSKRKIQKTKPIKIKYKLKMDFLFSLKVVHSI